MIQGLLNVSLLKPILKPLTRLFVGLIAVPIFRLFVRRGMKIERLDQELERDLEQWFRGALLLLVATANMEQTLFGWVPLDLQGDMAWIALLFRLLLAVGVIESMPDQPLFAILHPGPPKVKLGKGYFGRLWAERRAIGKGLICQHLNRSSAVFAIMAAIFGGAPGSTAATVGWSCYALAIVQYLIIGLVTSRDKAYDVIAAFDRSVAEQREDLVEEFLEEEDEERDGGKAVE
jgi:hypothetical protein